MTYANLLRKVMKAAHTIRVRDGKTMSQALKAAWAWAKKKLWYDYQGGKTATLLFSELLASTAKAIKVAVDCFYVDYDGYAGQAQVWLPKSQIEVSGKTVKLPVWLLCDKQDDAGRALRVHRTETVSVVFRQKK